jgi:hypothetical protein
MDDRLKIRKEKILLEIINKVGTERIKSYRHALASWGDGAVDALLAFICGSGIPPGS